LIPTELNELVAKIPPAPQSAADRALMIFEYMFDSSYFRDYISHNLGASPGWTRHFIDKLADAGLELDVDDKRGTVLEITSHLKARSAREKWIAANALLDLDPLLPEAIPLLVREVLTIQGLEWQRQLGWRIQLELIRLLVAHDDPLIARLIGTVGRQDGFKAISGFTNGLLRFARQILPDEANFERWFFEFSRVKYEDFARHQQEEYRKLEQGIEQRERERRERERERKQREPERQREGYRPWGIRRPGE
jgi:hypothetical protein